MKSNMKKPLAIAAVVASLAAGGSTFALWSDSASVDSGTITSGLLNVEANGSQAYDVSADRTDSPHEINLATWKAVPGDTVEVRTNLDVALKGDNMVAKLSTKDIATAIPDAAKQYVTIKAELRDASGKVVSTTTTDGNGTATSGSNVLLQANGDGQDAGKDDPNIMIVPDTIDKTTDAVAVYTVTFDKSTPEQVLTKSTLANLSDTGATLEQVRDPGTGNFK